jgi:hypothetical protein
MPSRHKKPPYLLLCKLQQGRGVTYYQHQCMPHFLCYMFANVQVCNSKGVNTVMVDESGSHVCLGTAKLLALTSCWCWHVPGDPSTSTFRICGTEPESSAFHVSAAVRLQWCFFGYYGAACETKLGFRVLKQRWH